MLCFGLLVMFCTATAPAPAAVSRAGYCDVMRSAIGGPFRASSHDTTKTRQDADTLNRVGLALGCWTAPKR